MLAIEMLVPGMGWLIPVKPSTTASMMSKTVTLTISRMKAGIIGVKLPQVLDADFDPESGISTSVSA